MLFRSDAYFARCPEADEGRRGNKMARERMTILYDVSAAERAMVLGTSNKTEILLGYSTLYGDSASAVNPIGDLYKTQVRQLARHLGIPSEVIEKPPSADLWEGQTDEDELGFTYERVDGLLAHMVDQRYRPARLRELGFDDLFVERVRELVAARGAAIVNLDMTLICERPKLGAHREAMAARVAELLGIDAGRVSVKATTTERLGFTGRREGIAGQCAASLRVPPGALLIGNGDDDAA